MKYALFVLLLTLLSITTFAQDYEYGKPSELKGLTKIYIDTGADLKNRTLIIEQIEKAKLSLEIVDAAKDAQIIMVFRGESKEVVTGTTEAYGSTVVGRATLASGQGLILIEGKDATKPRLILNFEDSQQNKLEKKPAIKFAKEFIKEYKKANGLK